MMAMKKKHQALLTNVGVLFITCIVMFLFLEGVFTVLDIGGLNPEQATWIKHRGYNPFLNFGPNVDMVSPQEFGKGVVWNSQGYRLDYNLVPEKEEGEVRIFALGGSTTENLGNAHNLHYCGEMESYLHAHDHSGVLCVNAAKSAYSSAQTIIRLQFEHLEYNPDVITVMHNINDMSVSFFPDREGPYYARKYLDTNYMPEYKLRRELGKSRVLHMVAKTLAVMRQKTASKKVVSEDGGVVLSSMRFNESFEYDASFFEDNIRSIVAIAEQHDIIVVLLSQPGMYDEDMVNLNFGHKTFNHLILYPPIDQIVEIHKDQNRIVQEIAQEEGVYFVDMANGPSWEREDFIDMVHFTDRGIQKFGAYLGDEMEDILQEELLVK